MRRRTHRKENSMSPCPAVPFACSRPAALGALLNLVLLSCMPAHAHDARLAEDLNRFVAWFGGEWNNNEQIWQQRVDAKGDKSKIADPLSHTHHIFAPVEVPRLGKHVFYVQQHLDADLTKSYRQRLYRLSADESEKAVKLEIFSLPDDKGFFNAHLTPEKFKDLDAAQLKTIPGCEVYWRYDEAAKAFNGTMKPNACSFFSQRSQQKIIISDTLKLTEGEIWINDQAKDEAGNRVFGSKTDTPIKNRKVRYFTGWAYLNHAGKNAGENDKEFSFRRDLVLHNEGQIIPLLYKDGTPSPYAIELAQLTYQNTKLPILKLAVLDRETKKSQFYIWANTDAKRIGLNLGWIQVGLTQKETRVNYGFGDAAPAGDVTKPTGR
jgi:hypothetical protein